MNGAPCQTAREQTTSYMQQETKNLRMIEKLVVATVLSYAMVFLLCGLKNRFAKTWLRLVSSACYMGVPVLISYTLGVMAKPGNSQGVEGMFTGLYGTWAVFLLFAHASFDNLTAFNLEEINGSSKLMFQFWSQYFLLLLMLNYLIGSLLLLPVLLVSLVVYLKVMERHFALAYASGSSSFLREKLRKMVNYQAGVGAEVDLSYLVGPKYATTKDGEIVEGITLEKVWGCNGKLLSTKPLDGQLKEMCLSFSLFWVLLAKIRGYRSVYTTRSSRTKAYKLVWERLLTDEDKAFRVIEVELSFLLDYFYSKYMLFYFNGIYVKAIPIIGFPIMYWYFAIRIFNFKAYNHFLAVVTGVDPGLNSGPFKILISVLYALEIIQLLLYVTSKWYNVTLICFYAKEKPRSFLRRCFGGVIRVICRVSLFTTSMLCKTWKRELNQYCLLKSCTCFTIDSMFLRLYFSTFGVSLPQPGMKEDVTVALSKDVKRAVILSLQTNGPNLSNGVASLRRSGLEEKLSWALNLKTNSEEILVWHIATSICEMKNNNQQDFKPQGFQVATTLSKYCAYLLNFAPLLVSIPVLEAEVVCETTIKEARALLKTPISYCGKVEEVGKYEKLMDQLTSDDEETGEGRENMTILQNGVRLWKDIVSIVEEERRWEILAEFWAEFILFLAPSDINEMAHVEKLAEGGEFITHLWALLIHAGILD